MRSLRINCAQEELAREEQNGFSRCVRKIDMSSFRTRIYNAQGGKCFHCNGLMDNDRYHRKQCLNGYTCEHLIPRSKGGKGGPNIVLAHHDCNNVRRDEMPTQDMLNRAALIHGTVGVILPRAIVKKSGIRRSPFFISKKVYNGIVAPAEEPSIRTFLSKDKEEENHE